MFLDFSLLSVDFESLVMYISRDLFKGSIIEAYIVVSCEMVVSSGTDLAYGTVGNRVPEVASASGGTGFVQPGFDGAALGLSVRLDSKLVLKPGWAPAPGCYRLIFRLAFASSGQIGIYPFLQAGQRMSIGNVMIVQQSLDLSRIPDISFFRLLGC